MKYTYEKTTQNNHSEYYVLDTETGKAFVTSKDTYPFLSRYDILEQATELSTLKALSGVSLLVVDNLLVGIKANCNSAIKIRLSDYIKHIGYAIHLISAPPNSPTFILDDSVSLLDTSFMLLSNAHPNLYLDITSLNDLNASKVYNGVYGDAVHIKDTPERSYRYLKSKLSNRYIYISDDLCTYIADLYRTKLKSYSTLPSITVDKAYKIKSKDKELETILNVCNKNRYLLRSIPEIDTLVHKEAIWH